MLNIGTLKFYDTACGFGLIELDAGGTDVYVDVSALRQSGLGEIVEGQRLIFDLVTDSRTGRRAAAFLRLL